MDELRQVTEAETGDTQVNSSDNKKSVTVNTSETTLPMTKLGSIIRRLQYFQNDDKAESLLATSDDLVPHQRLKRRVKNKVLHRI